MELVAWRNAVIFIVGAAALAMLFGGCASRDAAAPAPAAPAGVAAVPATSVPSPTAGTAPAATAAAAAPRGELNATVRSVTYREAAPNAGPVPAGIALDTAATPAAAVGAGRPATAKPGAASRASAASSRRAATPVRQRGSRPAAPAAKPVAATAPATAAARPASGWRYTYGVELDAGRMREFGFAEDQGLAVLDRVRVDGDRLVVPRR